ncbi:VC0807 family protein [Microlunatus sp. Gsoil 973]|uniref:VC0807 family protein n=1 Tax=Microlunatus sp. Gsoil 973 TaxID=2672569 RepID=UPI0012B4B21D|nr:VC0807 family protein [Microlunatus sp. Gsoil 973]QGN33339.1 hypothetical protein GJV80_11545 [Microlunatus sp. Gsoil 973]
MNSRAMIGRIVWTLFLDAGLAVAAYLIARQLGAGMFLALLIGTIVAGLRALYVIIRRREVDAFALFMIATFGIGLVLSLVTGSPRFLLAKDSISTAVSGVIFLGTLVAGRPMMYYLAQRFGATGDAEREEWARRWPVNAGFRSFFRGMTVVWGIAFLAEAAVKLILVLALPLAVAAPLVPFFTPVLITALVVWTVRTSVAAQKRLSVAQPVA